MNTAPTHDEQITRFLAECRESGINNASYYLADKMPRLYGYLKGAFPRGILPTDVDGEVEINGHFLRLEFKHEDLVRQNRIPKGQLYCFKRLLETGLHTIFLVGHDPYGEITICDMFHKNARKRLDPCDKPRFRQACKNWAKTVEPSWQ